MPAKPINNGYDAPQNTVSMEFPSLPENVAFARMAVALLAAQLDFTVDQIEEIKLAVSEAVSNAVIHGYKNGRGQVRLQALVYPDRLHVIITDNGVGIADVAWAMQPGNTTADNSMGLGLAIMQEYMDYLDLKTAPGQGTSVFMTKMLAPSQER